MSLGQLELELRDPAPGIVLLGLRFEQRRVVCGVESRGSAWPVGRRWRFRRSTATTIFTMQERRFESRHTATKAARRRRPNPADRLVLACSDCPTSKPSRRRSPRPGVVAEAVNAPVAAVRQALDAATAAERARTVPINPPSASADTASAATSASRSGPSSGRRPKRWADAVDQLRTLQAEYEADLLVQERC